MEPNPNLKLKVDVLFNESIRFTVKINVQVIYKYNNTFTHLAFQPWPYARHDNSFWSA